MADGRLTPPRAPPALSEPSPVPLCRHCGARVPLEDLDAHRCDAAAADGPMRGNTRRTSNHAGLGVRLRVPDSQPDADSQVETRKTRITRADFRRVFPIRTVGGGPVLP